MTITVDNLLLRPKLDCDGGYNVAVKGPSVVVQLNICDMVAKERQQMHTWSPRCQANPIVGHPSIYRGEWQTSHLGVRTCGSISWRSDHLAQQSVPTTLSNGYFISLLSGGPLVPTSEQIWCDKNLTGGSVNNHKKNSST